MQQRHDEQMALSREKFAFQQMHLGYIVPPPVGRRRRSTFSLFWLAVIVLAVLSFIATAAAVAPILLAVIGIIAASAAFLLRKSSKPRVRIFLHRFSISFYIIGVAGVIAVPLQFLGLGPYPILIGWIASAAFAVARLRSMPKVR